MRKPLLLSVAVLVLWTTFAHAQVPSPFIGTWKANPAKSKYNPGPAPKSQTLTWAPAANGALRFTVDTVTAEGQTNHTESILTFDGKQIVPKGTNVPANLTRVIKRIDERTYEETDSVDGKFRIMRRAQVAMDGKTLTVTSKGTNPQGRAVANVSFYEKQ